MSFSILSQFQGKQQEVSQSAFGLLSLREYYDSFKDKLLSFISNGKQRTTQQTVEWVDDITGESHRIVLSLDEYNAFVEDPLITASYIDEVTGESISLTGARILQLFPDWPLDTIDQSINMLRITINSNGHDIVAGITSVDYQKLLNDEVDSIQAVINAAGDTISVNKDEVLSRVEDMVDDISTQGEFLTYCLENETVDSQSFINNMLAGYSTVAKEKLEQYKALLSTGDPLESLKSFISLHQASSYEVKGDEGHEYIEVYNASDYYSASVIDIIWGKVTQVFGTVWNIIKTSVKKIGDIFASIWKGIVAGGKFILKLIANRFFTRYSKTTKSYGIIDCPICQFDLGKILHENSVSTLHLDMTGTGLKRAQRILCTTRDTEATNIKYANGTMKGCSKAIPIQTSMLRAFNSNSVTDVWGGTIVQLLKTSSEVVDGKLYIRPVDVFLPSRFHTEVGVILRFGPVYDSSNNEDRFFLQIFPFVPKNWMESFEDDGHAYLGIKDLLGECFASLADILPVLDPYAYNGLLNSVDGSISGLISVVPDMFATDITSGEYDNTDVVAHYLMFDDSKLHAMLDGVESSSATAINFIPAMRVITSGVIPYALSCMISQKDHLDDGYLYARSCMWDVNDYSHVINDGEWVEDFDPFDISELSLTTYASFIQRGLTPTSIHYQTALDIAQEAAIGVASVLALATAIFITVKFSMFKKNLKARAEIAQGYADDMSWKIGPSPSADQIKVYRKARKKANRLNKLCGKLGITSVADASNNLVSQLQNVYDRFNTVAGFDASKSDMDQEKVISLIDILKLIRA